MPGRPKTATPRSVACSASASVDQLRVDPLEENAVQTRGAQPAERILHSLLTAASRMPPGVAVEGLTPARRNASLPRSCHPEGCTAGRQHALKANLVTASRIEKSSEGAVRRLNRSEQPKTKDPEARPTGDGPKRAWRSWQAFGNCVPPLNPKLSGAFQDLVNPQRHRLEAKRTTFCAF